MHVLHGHIGYVKDMHANLHSDVLLCNQNAAAVEIVHEIGIATLLHDPSGQTSDMAGHTNAKLPKQALLVVPCPPFYTVLYTVSCFMFCIGLQHNLPVSSSQGIHKQAHIVCYKCYAMLIQDNGAAVHGTHLCWELPPQGPGPQSPGLEPSR